MRSTAIDFDFPLSRPAESRRARRASPLSQIHWPRAIALLAALAMWPAIIYAVSRLL